MAVLAQLQRVPGRPRLPRPAPRGHQHLLLPVCRLRHCVRSFAAVPEKLQVEHGKRIVKQICYTKNEYIVVQKTTNIFDLLLIYTGTLVLKTIVFSALASKLNMGSNSDERLMLETSALH